MTGFSCGTHLSNAKAFNITWDTNEIVKITLYGKNRLDGLGVENDVYGTKGECSKDVLIPSDGVINLKKITISSKFDIEYLKFSTQKDEYTFGVLNDHATSLDFSKGIAVRIQRVYSSGKRFCGIGFELIEDETA